MSVQDSGREPSPFHAARRITIVSGLPRSGTSLVVQILAAAGLAIAADDVRSPDPDNPRGYLELQAVKGLRRDAGFLEACRGRVVKVVAPLLLALPPALAYRVLFVERDLGEVLASQRTMLARVGRPAPTAADEAALARAYEGALSRCRAWLEAAPDAPVLFLSHRALLAKPDLEIERLSAFLERTGDPDEQGDLQSTRDVSDEDCLAERGRAIALRAAMTAAIDPTLYRSRAGI